MVVMRHLRHYTLQKGGPAWQGASGCLPPGRGLCRRAAGFSMVELLITLVLLGIVAAIASTFLPRLGRQLEPESRREDGLFRYL